MLRTTAVEATLVLGIWVLLGLGAAGDAGVASLADPVSLARVGQLLPAGSIWLYVGVVAFAAVLVYAGSAG